ncbi:hypothetical protein JCM1393_20580 [Clostridium carnis]
MKEFFILKIPNESYRTSLWEQIIPIIILIVIIIGIKLYKEKIKENKIIDKIIRYTIGILSIGVFTTYYISVWIIEGIKADNLPFHLCYLTSIFCMVLVFTKNKKLFNFSIFAGVIGGISSLISIDMELSFRYFKYYQFMVAHTTIVIIPLYFAIIYEYLPSIKDTLKMFLKLQILGILMGIFNNVYKTNYFFVSFGSNEASKGTILSSLGEGNMYFINLELLVIVCIIIWFVLINIIFNRRIITKYGNFNKTQDKVIG